MNNDHDPINKPLHYQHPSGVECIEITEHLNFCLGNAIKYIWRCDHKGQPIEDLRKAVVYLNREITRRLALEKPLPIPCGWNIPNLHLCKPWVFKQCPVTCMHNTKPKLPEENVWVNTGASAKYKEDAQ